MLVRADHRVSPSYRKCCLSPVTGRSLVGPAVTASHFLLDVCANTLTSVSLSLSTRTRAGEEKKEENLPISVSGLGKRIKPNHLKRQTLHAMLLRFYTSPWRFLFSSPLLYIFSLTFVHTLASSAVRCLNCVYFRPI